ncbi:MAG: tetratricopeptide repeat protein [Armatimonadia bacterium]
MWPFRRRRQSPAHRSLTQANEALRKGDLPSAITLYNEFLQEHPEHLGALVNLGTALHLSGQHSRAIERFQQALSHDPGNASALINLAAAHGALGHLDKGIQTLVRALDVAPTKRDLHYNLAALYLRKGELANAMAELELELALHSDHKLASQTLNELRRLHMG